MIVAPPPSLPPAYVVAGAVAALVALLAAWSARSSRERESLRNGDYAAMEILSETRPVHGDASRIPAIARGRKGFEAMRRSSLLRRSFRLLAASSSPHEEGDDDDEVRRRSIRARGDVAFRYTDDGGSWEMYGRRVPTKLGLRELVAEKSTAIVIEEDMFKRMNWSEKMDECVPVSDEKVPPNIVGSYTFCHRDYVNHEELMGMMWKRGGIEGFLFKPSRAGEMVVGDDSACVLTERSRLFHVVPLSIVWEGRLDGGTVTWHSSSLTLGWDFFGKFFDRPPAAERLRKDPWHVSTMKGDATGDVLCFERAGKGRLVFAREECMAEGAKSR